MKLYFKRTEQKEKQRERNRKRYWANVEENRAKARMRYDIYYKREKVVLSPEEKAEARRKYQREYYHSHTEQRRKVLNKQRERYLNDPEWRQAKLDYAKRRRDEKKLLKMQNNGEQGN